MVVFSVGMTGYEIVGEVVVSCFYLNFFLQLSIRVNSTSV